MNEGNLEEGVQELVNKRQFSSGKEKGWWRNSN